MGPRVWITAGWLLLAVAVAAAIVAVVLVLGADSAIYCVQLAGVKCLQNAQLFAGLICAVCAGAAFFSALACFFWAAHLRTMDALRALSGGKTP